MTAAVQTSMAADRLDAVQVKRDFPLLREAPLARGLHYLDNAATTHKPQAVIDAVSDCYAQAYGPIHRGLYPLAEAATARYEQSRQTLADFIGLDICLDIMNVLYDGFGDSKYRPCPLLRNYVAAGWLGRKAGRGFYVYDERGKKKE